MEKTPPIKKLQDALMSLILLFVLTSKSAAAPILIENFSSTGESNLDETLSSITQTIRAQNNEKISIEFKDQELRKGVIPAFKVRRVFLVDLLTAIAKLSHTEINYEKATITVSPTKGVVSDNPPSNPQSDLDFQKKGLTPLDTKQAIVQLYNLGTYLRVEDSLGLENILAQLQTSLTQTAKFRGDATPQFEFHYIETAEAVYLKAPVQYHLSLTNQLASLPAAPAEDLYELVPIPVKKNQPPQVAKLAPPKSDLTVLITAIQELSNQVNSLQVQVQSQQKTIDQLRKTSPPKSE